jgi:hypothetical protein
MTPELCYYAYKIKQIDYESYKELMQTFYKDKKPKPRIDKDIINLLALERYRKTIQK